jgi:hypothetical protein
MTHKANFFQAAKDVLNTISEMESEIRGSTFFSSSFENLEDRQMMTATGFENIVESEPITFAEVAPEVQGSAATIDGVNIRINGQGEYISAVRP